MEYEKKLKWVKWGGILEWIKDSASKSILWKIRQERKNILPASYDHPGCKDQKLEAQGNNCGEESRYKETFTGHVQT